MNELERKEAILDCLKNKEYVLVEELVEQTGASIATVRRDIKKLVDENKILRFRGGVSLKENIDPTDCSSLDDRLENNVDVKKKIAQYAASLIKEGDIIYIDGGSTTYYIPDYLKTHNIRVTTNSIYTATKLLQLRIPTYITGGEIPYNDYFTIFSQDAINVLDTMNFDKAFVGGNGFDPVKGLSSVASIDARMKSCVLSRATNKYILLDSSKIGIVNMYSVKNTDDAILITDYEDTNGTIKNEIKTIK